MARAYRNPGQNHPAGHWANETRSETLSRLARKAVRDGIKLFRLSGYDGVCIATSSGNSDVVYMVRPGCADRSQGCTCPGYQEHWYCKHYALACVEAGLFPMPPDDGAAALASPVPDYQKPAHTGWCVACGAYGPLQSADMCPSCEEGFSQIMADVPALDAAGMVAG